MLILMLGSLFAQRPGLDASLFGNQLPPIPDKPDTGDSGWITEEAPAAPKAAPPQDAAPPAESSPSTNTERPVPRLPVPGKDDKEKAKEPKPEKRSWLPWKRRKQEEERLKKERAKYGPRLGETKHGISRGGGGGDIGLLPSELRRWQRDPRKAMREAKAERKMLMLWLMDSKRSTPSKQMAVELFRHTQFLRMAKDHMVLTKVDYGETDIAAHPYAKFLKEKLNALGYPILVLFSPDSEEMWRYKGYRTGRYPDIIGELRHEVKTFQLRERDRQEKLIEGGFRTWRNHKKEEIFAKAIGISREEKTVTLVDDFGRKGAYSVLKLSREDLDYLSKRFPLKNAAK